MKSLFSVVIPARNEESTIQNVIKKVSNHPNVKNVIVVDNGSIDDTANAAVNAGAYVISEPVQGIGRAIKRGIAVADTEYILRTDADIKNWDSDWLRYLCQSKANCLTRAIFKSTYDEFPVTRLVVKPYLEAFVPPLANLQTPISGTYFFKTDIINWQNLPDDWSWDIALIIKSYERGLIFNDIDIGVLIDKKRDIRHYETMARDIHRYFLNKYISPKEGQLYEIQY